MRSHSLRRFGQSSAAIINRSESSLQKQHKVHKKNRTTRVPNR